MEGVGEDNLLLTMDIEHPFISRPIYSILNGHLEIF